MLSPPKLIITPPTREPTPQPITPAAWERYPGITFAAPPSKPKARTSSPWPPAYRPPPPVEVVPTASEKRWYVSGRARGKGWAPAAEAVSPIHDAADDAFMAAFGEGILHYTEKYYAEKSSGVYDYTEEKEGCREVKMDAAASYAAFTTAYAHVELGAWQHRRSRPPPPVRPLDLPGSPCATAQPARDVEQHEVKRYRRSSWWSLGKW